MQSEEKDTGLVLFRLKFGLQIRIRTLNHCNVLPFSSRFGHKDTVYEGPNDVEA